MNPLPGVQLTPDGRFHLFGAEHPLQKASGAFLLRAASATLLAEALAVASISLALLAHRGPPVAPVILPDNGECHKIILPPAPDIAPGHGGVKIADPTAGGRSNADLFARANPVDDLLADYRTIASMDEAFKPYDPNAIDGTGDGLQGHGVNSAALDSLAGSRFVLPSDEPLNFAEVMPRTVRSVSPDYPSTAREAGVEGTVLVRAWVGADGRVKQTRILSGPESLAPSAARAVAQWVFTPALQGGRPVAVWCAVPIRFILRD